MYMYDCSKEFNKFYRTEVVLSAKDENELREKRKLNIKRLKDGLTGYNTENGTNYKVSENRIQGSMAMHTAVQNDENDYDIDVGIVFEAENLDDMGPLATRNMVANALERKTKQFAESPDVKTSCVRLNYSSTGYHIDFAVFDRERNSIGENEYIYKHAGVKWTPRGIKALEEWFSNETKSKGNDFRKIVRLSKMFCKSQPAWKNMPSGLIQTVLCEEKYASNYSRIDELFYYTMSAIVDRLEIWLEVAAPVDNGRPLVTREVDYTRMKNWKNRLKSKLDSLDILFENNCGHNDAINAWYGFFNHKFWENNGMTSTRRSFDVDKVHRISETEEFIEDLYPVHEQYEVNIDCKVSGNGFRVMPIGDYLDKYVPRFKKFIPYNFSIDCKVAYTDCPSYDKILWKVLNVGEEARRRNDIRGRIEDRGEKINENSTFKGNHYIECYLIKNGICVGIGHINVPIGQEA